ncbi:helix-turn-helix domain-containing protein [Desmospora activa]|uniref:helix-turn-helix domain-containing protein n=1 Tax=Desmospora activa TaxID=500615 RepID=UPI00147655CA|nr:helix-turn-helix domain-containing protein [Desmospora activa]
MIRKARKERGLRLEDLADDNISPATISNIERGVPHVSQDKAMYLLKKLDLSLEKIPELMIQERTNLEELKRKFRAVESLLMSDQINEALKLLNTIELEEKHILSSLHHYLLGRCFIEKEKWNRAERSFHRAIQLAAASGNQSSNIEAVSFHALGYVCYRVNNIDKALQYTDSAISAYAENGERSYIIWSTLRNKAIYLERLGRLTESMNIVQEVWDSLSKIDDVEVRLTFYWLRSDISRRMGMLDEAIKYAYEGEELATLNKVYYSSFVLWMVIGNSHLKRNELDQAEFCFNHSLSLISKLDNVNKNSLTNLYSRLSVLYMKKDNVEKSFYYIDQAIQNAKKHNDAPRLIKALIIKGTLLKSTGEREDAIKEFEVALDLSRKYNYKKNEHLALYHLANCWDGVNEKEFLKYSRSMYLVQQNLRLNEEEILDETAI